eukprot:3592619-Lingulodinium_polyedra.AAC.1
MITPSRSCASRASSSAPERAEHAGHADGCVVDAVEQPRQEARIRPRAEGDQQPFAMRLERAVEVPAPP